MPEMFAADRYWLRTRNPGHRSLFLSTNALIVHVAHRAGKQQDREVDLGYWSSPGVPVQQAAQDPTLACTTAVC